MIKSFLICNSDGLPFYSKKIDQNFKDYDPHLFSGWISAISIIGKKLFQEEIATLSFGINKKASIVILPREFFGFDKVIFFVFLIQDEIDHKQLRQLCTNILIESKEYLKTVPLQSDERFKLKIDKVVDSMKDSFL